MNFRSFVAPLIITSFFLSLGGLIAFPAFTSARYNARRSSCQSNLKQIALACSQYLQDNNGRFPAVSRGKRGWADALAEQSGAKTYSIFHCPAVRQAAETRSSDYFLNVRVGGIPNVQLKFPTHTIAFGEGAANGGTNSHYLELPFSWKISDESPARRHPDGANYAFADGHVKWLRPEKISTESPKGSQNLTATFAVR